MNIACYIDHTLLAPETTADRIRKLCDEAALHAFASVCVSPVYVPLAAECLAGSAVKVCAVIGFPSGAMTTAAKAFETADAVAAGADEVDMVLSVGRLKSGLADEVREDVAAVVKAADGRTVKVIIETSLLTRDEKVLACKLAVEAGADFVKTSTGFAGGGATVDDIRLMRGTVGPAVGVKASGGIRSREDALAMIAAGATRIGTSAGLTIVGAGPQGNGGY